MDVAHRSTIISSFWGGGEAYFSYSCKDPGSGVSVKVERFMWFFGAVDGSDGCVSASMPSFAVGARFILGVVGS